MIALRLVRGPCRRLRGSSHSITQVLQPLRPVICMKCKTRRLHSDYSAIITRFRMPPEVRTFYECVYLLAVSSAILFSESLASRCMSISAARDEEIEQIVWTPQSNGDFDEASPPKIFIKDGYDCRFRPKAHTSHEKQQRHSFQLQNNLASPAEPGKVNNLRANFWTPKVMINERHSAV